MALRQFKITIDPTGQVRVQMGEPRDRHWIEYAKWFAEILGPITEQDLVLAGYDPDEKVRIDLEARAKG